MKMRFIGTLLLQVLLIQSLSMAGGVVFADETPPVQPVAVEPPTAVTPPVAEPVAPPVVAPVAPVAPAAPVFNPGYPGGAVKMTEAELDALWGNAGSSIKKAVAGTFIKLGEEFSGGQLAKKIVVVGGISIAVLAGSYLVTIGEQFVNERNEKTDSGPTQLGSTPTPSRVTNVLSAPH